jgi:hypothetical protein
VRPCPGLFFFFAPPTAGWAGRQCRANHPAPASGPTLPPPSLAICVLDPRTPEKERFRTHEGRVVRAWEAAPADALAPYVADLRQRGTA